MITDSTLPLRSRRWFVDRPHALRIAHRLFDDEPGRRASATTSTFSGMGEMGVSVDGYRIEPLGPATWEAYAGLAGRHNGVWGGCWCVFFHAYPDPPDRKQLGNRGFKHLLVEQNRTHAAVVFEGDEAIAWAQYGPVAELPNIHHRKEWAKGVVDMPDYRITCLFVDRRYRRQGMAAIAVRGALGLIAAAGGGLVESYPHDLPRRRRRRLRSSTTPPAACTNNSGSPISAPRARATAL